MQTAATDYRLIETAPIAHIYGSAGKGWTLYWTTGAALEDAATVGHYATKIGMQLGAALGNMGHAWWAQSLVELVVRNRATLRDVYVPYGDSMFMVNRYGRRALNEKAPYNERGQVHYTWDASRREYPNYLMFWVFDDWLINGPLASDPRYALRAPPLPHAAGRRDARVHRQRT